MKKLKAMFMLAAASVALAACDQKPEQLPGGDEPVVVDDCPEGISESGDPCK